MTDPVTEAVRLLSLALDEARLGALHLDDAELTGQVQRLQQVVNVASAVQAVRVAQFAAREETRLDDGSWVSVDRGLGHVSDFAGEALGPMLGLSPLGARGKVGRCALWASRLPVTLGALGAGDLDPWRASVVADELAGADAPTCAKVESAVFPAATGDTPGQLRRRVRRALAVVDADAVQRRAARALSDRYVRVRPGETPGVTQWSAVLSSETSALCWAALDDMAHRSRGDGDGRTVDQLRADALGDLILGNATVTATAHLMIPVQPPATVLEAADQRGSDQPAAVTGVPDVSGQWFGSCEVPGVGVIPPDVVAGVCARFDTRIARVLLDPVAGVTLESGAATYRPPPRIKSFVELRDGICRFPGCARAARRCDTDHITPWPAGVTAVTNLLTLCRHHHRAKHEAGWDVTMTTDGTCTWISRLGQQYLTRPASLRRSPSDLGESAFWP